MDAINTTITDTMILGYGFAFIISFATVLLVSGTSIYSTVMDRREGYYGERTVDPFLGAVFGVALVVAILSGAVFAKGLLG